MASPVALFVGLDVVSALLTLALGALLVRTWALTRAPIALLLGVAFILLGASYATVTASQFDLGRSPDLWDELRLAGQTGASLVLFLTYLSSRASRNPVPFRVLAGAVGALTVAVGLLDVVLPSLSARIPERQYFLGAHLVMAMAFGACAFMAARGFGQHPTRDRALVPLAFLFFAISKYTWFIIDLTRSDAPVGLIYAWRFAGIALLGFALVRPLAGRPPHAPT